MKIDFTKMHGCGNDYIYVDMFKTPAFDFEKAAIALSDRHFGIGGDGIILVCPSDKADAKMRIFNADGSEGMMCGNGIRCVGKYVYDSGIARKEVLTIDSLSGVKTLHMTIENGKAAAAREKADRTTAVIRERKTCLTRAPHCCFRREFMHAP